MLEARLIVNVQILGGIVVGHMDGHIELNATQLIHQLFEAIHVDAHIEVNGDTQHIGNGIPQNLDPLLVDRVQLAALHQGISGDGHHAHRLRHRIIGADNHGIGIAAHLVLGHQQKGISIKFPLPACGGLGTGPRLSRFRRRLRRHFRLLGQQLVDAEQRYNQS